MHERATTGLSGLDGVLKGILPGDNIVWQVASIENYRPFVEAFCRAAELSGRKLIYFRFAGHASLAASAAGAEVHELRPQDGFEAFLTRIHSVIDSAGRGAAYVFDCLSELAGDWYSDQMLGNFFMLTCPRLYDLETIAYFAIYRDHHSAHALGPIVSTTQLFVDVYGRGKELYIHPVKVQHRYSSTMHMLHEWNGDAFSPVASSCVTSEIMTGTKWSGLQSTRRPGFWERTFREAEEMLELMRVGQCPAATSRALFERLLGMVVSRDGGMRRLVTEYLTLNDILEVRKRMIGTGLIGGKAVGMLVARAVLKLRSQRFAPLLEEHDSFFVGSDVFYTFLVRNGVWWLRQKQRSTEALLEGAEQARQRILTGVFPEHTLAEFEEMLDYFGQSPFIVRSSSLLEDNYGNSFAGKYDSVFCANQGPRERRLEDMLAAVRTVYASALGERALRYRAQKGLLDRDEQMALLIMRVSGTMHGRKFFPPLAGVGFSFNPYCWSREIDPHAGVVRLVFGLGTRAVERRDDDYTRVVALNEPLRRPEAGFAEVRRRSQHSVDYIDLDANRLVSGHFTDVLPDVKGVPMDLFVSGSPARDHAAPVLTFDRLLTETGLVEDLRDALRTLERAYEHPVDIEFTCNFLDDSSYKINLVQCRPLPVRGTEVGSIPGLRPEPEEKILDASGAVIGHSRATRVDWVIFVVPGVYGALSVRDRHGVATAIGEVNRRLSQESAGTIMLIGPGRWGTSSPSLGVPVSFADINRTSIICEVVAMHEGLVPDVSLGTHFLNELIEMDILYMALFPERPGNSLELAAFTGAPNRLAELVPSEASWAGVLRVLRADDIVRPGSALMLWADAVDQRAMCFVAPSR